MILNKLLILILSVESFAYNRYINITENILNNSEKQNLLKIGAHEQTHRIAEYKKDNLTDSFKGIWWHNKKKLQSVILILF